MRALLTFLLVTGACTKGGELDAGVDAGGTCEGTPRFNCDNFGGQQPCPTPEQICPGVEGFAEYSCCYCNERSEWDLRYIWCYNPVPDAGPGLDAMP
jgi:hypothetical protein